MSAVLDPQVTQERSSACWLFDISGMDCGDCARTIEAGVRRLPGVETATVNFGAGTLTVTPGDRATSPESVVSAVSQAGYRAVPRGTSAPTQVPWWRERRVLEVGIAALLWCIGFALHLAGAPVAVSAVPYLAAMVTAGYPVFRAAWFAVKAHRADMNLLMAIAAVGALPLGEWEEGSSVLILFSLGLLLQSHTVERTRRAIQGLMKLAPEEATVLRQGQEYRVPAASLAPSDLVLVRPGERVPADGAVLRGSSEIDQSAITGESVPVDVESGTTVFAGTMNGSGALEILVSKPASESTLAGIIHLVEEAQSSRAPSQAFIDRFAAIYTPLVVLAAILLAAIGTVLTGDAHHWLFQGLVLLVVACPCALVISTPVALVSAIGSAARRGVLFKGGAAVEALASVRAVAFDKTGTLTHGRPTVMRIIPFDGATDDEVLSLAAAVERGAAHPIARGIVHAADHRDLSIPPASDYRSLAGRGAVALVSGAEVTVGNPRLVEALPASIHGVVEEIERGGEIAVVVRRGSDVVGVIGLADPPRPASKTALSALSALGLRSVMVSGDSRCVAERIGSAVGIEDIRAELMPHEKVDIVRELSSHGGVAMVGDGINDAPALAAATTGIAMGVAGSDVALEAADVALLADDLHQLPFSIRLSRSTLRVIRQNVAVSLFVKIVFLALTVAGVTNLWLAVAADMGTSLLVTLNALRLLHFGKNGR